MAELSEAVGSIDTNRGLLPYPSSEDAYAQYAEDKPGDTVPFYETEGRLLALWDQLNEMKLEIAVLQASTAKIPSEGDVTDEEVRRELEKAEKECLVARAEYMLRQSVVEDTIIASPILNAIHAGSNATGTERAIKPLLGRRDTLEIASTNLISSLESIIAKLRKAEIENLKTTDRNRGLASQLLAVTDKIEDYKDSVKQEPQLKARLEETRQEAITAAKQWRIMKSVVSAVIAGSGVDWSRDSELKDLVLDAEDERD